MVKKMADESQAPPSQTPTSENESPAEASSSNQQVAPPGTPQGPNGHGGPPPHDMRGPPPRGYPGPGRGRGYGPRGPK